MRKYKLIFVIMMLVGALFLAACDDSDEDSTPEVPANDSAETSGSTGENSQVSNSEGLEGFLADMNEGAVPMMGGEGSLDYGLGYFLHYAPIETTGVDNLIYNALVVHKQLNDGEYTADDMTNGQQNLLNITDGIVFNPEVDLTAQLGQSPEVREAILARLTADQTSMSPDDALESNDVAGIAALKNGADIGRKYLVYGQDTPDSEFEFIGVILIVDASGSAGGGETYSFQGWENLPLLGDASGPFWNEIPSGVSGDPTNENEGRPGVLLISEQTFQELN